MSDQFAMGRSDQKGRKQEADLAQAVDNGTGSVKGARKSLGKVDDSFKSQAEILIDRAETVFGQLKKLVAKKQYSAARDVLDAYEQTNATALAELVRRVDNGELSLTMVAVVVENLRTARRYADGL
jgi:hypothetical protein